MARTRNIKPGFFKNEDLSDLSPYSRLLFIGLWCLADREGLLEDRPKRIKGELFPYEDVDVDKCLQELHNVGFIIRYEIKDNRFISIPKFIEHQNPHYREVKSKIPKPFQRKRMHEDRLGQGNAPVTSSKNEPVVENVVVGGRPLYICKSLYDLCKHYFPFTPNQSIVQLLHTYLDDGVQVDMLAWAMRNAAEKGKAWGYAKGTIENLFSRGVRTADQAETANLEFQQQQKQARKVPIQEDKPPSSVHRQIERNSRDAEKGVLL